MCITLRRGSMVLASALALGAFRSLLGNGSDSTARELAPQWPPKGQSQRIAIARDVWVSAVGRETEGNNGGASRLKLKGVQEMTLLDADLAHLNGRRVTGALLHVRCITPADPAKRVSVSTVATPWVEGTASRYARQEGSACFLSPALGQRDWTYPGSTLLDSAWGRGHTLWRFAEATPPDAEGWQAIAIEPDVVAANAVGLSHGFAAMDDVGSEWGAPGGVFQRQTYPNRFFGSRDQSNAAPWLEVWTDGEDREPPEPVSDVTVETAGLPAGQAMVRWRTPPDRGGSRTLGFQVRYDAGAGEKPVPRYLIPMARKAGEEVRMLLQDLDLPAGATLRLVIEPVDAAGNRGPSLTRDIVVSSTPETVPLPPINLQPFPPSDELPQAGGLRVAVLDALDKVEARSGRVIPAATAGYKGGNHLWSAARRLVRLQSARNEAVAFTVNLEGRSDAVTARLVFPETPKLQPAVYRLDCVATPEGMMPDAAIPLTGPFAVPPRDDPQAADGANASLLCEVYVPHDTPTGPLRGALTLTSGGESLELTVELSVWDFALPDVLSFVPEMNAYGTANPTTGLAYYRMAHEHRTCLNRLYYGWSGAVDDGGGPRAVEGAFDWGEFDREFGPLFDGTAFRGLRRDGVPVDVFYLPLNEGWPVPVKPHYRPSYWADEAYDPSYAKGFRDACAEFARHINERGWATTVFQFYLNNKVYYKQGRRFDSIPAKWTFDEPAQTQDFWALRWYGILFHEGVQRHRGDAKLWFRADISRTEFGRELLWGVLDMEVMGGTTPQKARMKRDEQFLWAPSHHMEYGCANAPHDPNTQPVVWSLLAWSRGGRGVLPWQTIGTEAAWATGEATSLFYPSAAGPVASLRLKAFTRGQQDVEYLTLLADVLGVPSFAVAGALREGLDLTGRIHKTSEEDAGTLRFDRADPVSLWRLRTRVGAAVSAHAPAYRHAVRPFSTVPRDLRNLPEVGYVTVAPPVVAAGPAL